MKIEIKKVDKEIEKEAAEETFGIRLIPENKEEHGILERFWEGGAKVTGYSSNGSLLLTFADLIRSEETRKLSIDELERKINALVGLFDITDEHALRWYLAGLIDGCKARHNRQMKAGEKLRVKLKGIDFFTSGMKGCTIRAGDALVLLGESKDGRPTTQVIPWDAIIEVKAEPYCPVVITSVQRKNR